MAGALTIYIEMYFERPKIEFGYDIILMKSFCKGGILPTSNKNVPKKLGFTNKSTIILASHMSSALHNDPQYPKYAHLHRGVNAQSFNRIRITLRCSLLFLSCLDNVGHV